MVISQATEYSIRALLHMATFPSDQIISKHDICKSQGITPGFFIKIMQPLLANGLVKSYRGVKGGFSLGKPSNQISIWDIVTATEGPIFLNKCVIHPGYCQRDENCPVHLVWQKAKEALKKTLSETTLEKLVQQIQLQKS